MTFWAASLNVLASPARRLTTVTFGPAAARAAAALVKIGQADAPLYAPGGPIHGYVNFVQGDHGSIIDDVVPAVTQEMQLEAISFTGAAIPPLIPLGSTPGTQLLLANPSVIQR